MEQRRKILIPTGADPEEQLPPPHFDTEAAMAARPVVPLNSPDSDVASAQSALYTPVVAKSTTRYSPWLLALVVVAAMSVGAAAALAIDYYRNHEHADAPVASGQTSQPITSNTPSAAQPVEETRKTEPPSAPSVIAVNKASDQPSPAPSPAVVVPETTTPQPVVLRPKVSPAPSPQPPARAIPKRDETKAAPSDAKQEKPRKVEEIIIPDEKKQGREKRRRQPRDIEVSPQEVQRQVNRASQGLHRIREIFEGPQP